MDAPFPNDSESAAAFIENVWNDVTMQLRGKAPPARGSGSDESDDPSRLRNAYGHSSQPYRTPPAPTSGYAYDMSLVDGYSYSSSGYNRQMADPTQFRNAHGYRSHPACSDNPKEKKPEETKTHDVSFADGYSYTSENNRNINTVVTTESVSADPSQFRNNNNKNSKGYCCCFPWG